MAPGRVGDLRMDAVAHHFQAGTARRRTGCRLKLVFMGHAIPPHHATGCGIVPITRNLSAKAKTGNAG